MGTLGILACVIFTVVGVAAIALAIVFDQASRNQDRLARKYWEEVRELNRKAVNDGIVRRNLRNR